MSAARRLYRNAHLLDPASGLDMPGDLLVDGDRIARDAELISLNSHLDSDSTAVLEELHRPLVLLGGSARLERAEVATSTRFRILLPRIESIFAGLQLANHRFASA
jgi:hypothetical protein